MPKSPAAKQAAHSLKTLATPSLDSKPLRMSYRIAKGEQGVLTFEPYKSALLPHWRFKTPAIASDSASTLWAHFQEYGTKGDFVGMDMARKFIQMGMTRAKRYANHKGGRKYAKEGPVGSNGKRKELPRSMDHDGKAEKEEASLIFRRVWEACKEDDVYLDLKEKFVDEQREWDEEQKAIKAVA